MISFLFSRKKTNLGLLRVCFSFDFSVFICYNKSMKKKTAPVQKKCFRFQFTPVVLLMSAAALLVCALGIALSVYNIFKSGLHSFTDFLKYPFLILISIALAVIVVALLIKSQYIVDDKNFTTQFGLIKSKCALKDITSVVLDRDTNKLTVYMGEAYSVLSVQPSWNEDFVRALLKGNPSIDYSYTIRENNPDEDDKKKK